MKETLFAAVSCSLFHVVVWSRTALRFRLVNTHVVAGLSIELVICVEVLPVYCNLVV